MLGHGGDVVHITRPFGTGRILHHPRNGHLGIQCRSHFRIGCRQPVSAFTYLDEPVLAQILKGDYPSLGETVFPHQLAEISLLPEVSQYDFLVIRSEHGEQSLFEQRLFHPLGFVVYSQRGDNVISIEKIVDCRVTQGLELLKAGIVGKQTFLLPGTRENFCDLFHICCKPC